MTTGIKDKITNPKMLLFNYLFHFTIVASTVNCRKITFFHHCQIFIIRSKIIRVATKFSMNLVLFLVVIPKLFVSCQVLDSEGVNRTSERPYCFRFTWLGPKYNDESQFKNATCSDILKDDKSVPCTHPLVVTS